MKTYIKFTLVFLLVSSILAQDLILTSDNKVDVLEDDSPVRNIEEAGQSYSGSLRQDTVQVFGGSFGGSSGGDRWTFGNREGSGGNKGSSSGSVRPIQPRNGGSSSAGKASFGEPNAEAMAEKSDKMKASTFSAAPSAAEQSLRNARWIYAGGSRRKAVFVTPCFQNHCPNGEYTLHIQATCQYTVQLIDQNGNVVKYLGSGYAWVAGTIKFTAPCGSYRIRITLSCSCACPYVCFNLFQDRKDCFICSKDPAKDLYLTYNPQTCQCECASTCQDCRKPQIWTGFPDCRCVCPKVQVCGSNQYFDKKECRCKCLPNCCPAWPNTSCGC